MQSVWREHELNATIQGQHAILEALSQNVSALEQRSDTLEADLSVALVNASSSVVDLIEAHHLLRSMNQTVLQQAGIIEDQ